MKISYLFAESLLYLCLLPACIGLPSSTNAAPMTIWRGDTTVLTTSSVDDLARHSTAHSTGYDGIVSGSGRPTTSDVTTATDDVITTSPPSERTMNDTSTDRVITTAMSSASVTPESTMSMKQTTVETGGNFTQVMTTTRSTSNVTTSGEWIVTSSITTDVATSISTTTRLTSAITHASTTAVNSSSSSRPSSGPAIVISILILLLVLVAGVGAYLYVRYFYHQRQTDSEQSEKQKQVQLATLPSVRSKPIKSMDFHSYVKNLERDSGLLFTVEYEDLKFVGRDQSWEHAEMQCNRAKNRFTNILPYDRTRVKLLPLEDVDGSDYINANWIPGYSSKREFIATQGPLPSTKDDFWRLIWEFNCRAVVMLTLCAENGRIKCDQYWPADSEPLFYGDLQIQIMNETISRDWHIREIDISLGEQTRRIKHFHYVEWPDMKVPDKLSMLAFVRLVRTYVDDKRGCPVIVHCSAGVGRTGTFIALDVLTQQLQQEDIIDVYAVVYQMRMSRVLMVQTEQQYVFIHECVKHVLNERDRINSQSTITQNGDIVYMNCLDLESPASDESSTEEVEASLSDEGIEDESCDGI